MRFLAVLAMLPAAAFAQTTTLNLSEDLVRLGIASANMVPNQPSLDARPLLEKGVAYANQNRFSIVIADPGSYYFLSQCCSDRHVNLTGVENLTIDLQGSDLFLANTQKNGIGFTTGKNSVLQNFTVDYLQLPFTQVQITAVNAAQRQIQFTIPVGWQKPSALNGLLNPSGSTGTFLFVYRDGQPWTGYSNISVQQPFSDTVITLGTGDSNVTAALLAQIRAGDTAVLSVRGSSGDAIVADGGSSAGCNGCTFRNIRIYSGLVGVYIDGAQSSLLDHVYVMPRPGTDRLVSTMADGISPTQMGPNNILRLCRAIRTLDDGISPHTLVFGSVQSAPTSRTLQVQGDPNTAYNANGYFSLPNGSNVVFERPSDGAILGSASVVSQAAAPAPNGLPQIVLTFASDLPSNMVGTYIYSTDASWRSGNLLLEQNTVQQQGRARGISLWGLVNTDLVGNYVRRSQLTGVDIQHQVLPGDWVVPPAVNVTLTNNVIDGTNTVTDPNLLLKLAGIEAIAQQGDGSPMISSPHQNLTLTGNFIADPAYSAIWMGNATGGSINGNYLFDPNNNPDLNTAYYPFASELLQPVVVETSHSVTVGANTIDQTSERMFVTDTSYNELAAYEPGSIYQLNAYNLGTLANPGLTLTDSGGNTSPVTIMKTTTHALNVQIPASAALGGAYLTLTSGVTKYFATLFLDSQDNIPAVNGCTYETSLSSASVPSSASSVPILVVTQAGCSYQVLATDAFVNSGVAAVGTGVLTVGLAANAGGARNTTIEIAGQPIALTQTAGLGPTITGVVNGASFLPDDVSASTWITIQGTNLSATSRQWTSSDFVGNNLSTQLDGVSVTIDGIPAYVYYISPMQLNVLSPNDGVSGEVQVQVSNNAVPSQAFTVNEAAFTPAFFLFTSKYPAAVHLSGVNVGSTGLISGANFSPATSGETIELFGTGFGPTNPPSFAGKILAAPVPLANSVTVTIGGVPAQVLFAGLASNGLVQLNVTVPAGLPNGDAPILATVNSTTTQSNLFLTIQN